jgi:hypothetical protein
MIDGTEVDVDTPRAAAPAAQTDDARRTLIESHESRNLYVLAAQQVILRIGWIFKTESVIMPDFLDAIAGAGWIRGLLPVLNRVGQSLPPILFAESQQRTRVKTRVLFWMTLLMSAPFLALGTLWAAIDNPKQAWLPPLFLVLYFVFFAFNGLNQLAFGTVQGKLIRAHRRGWLLGLSGVVGSFSAVAAAILLLPRWLALPNDAGYAHIFIFNGASYLLSALVLAACVEPADARQPRCTARILDHFRSAWAVYRSDRQFRRVARVAMCFISAVLIFPHYQWLARERLGSTNEDLLVWVVAQNVSLGIFSPMLGWVADRRGNRLSSRISIFLSALAPLLAMYLASSHFAPATGRRWYWLTFALLGLCPLTMRTISNYVLELVDESQHSRYLSTMTLCFAVPFVLAPGVGWLVDNLPYQWTFVGVSAVIALGGVLTFVMPEPREHSMG